MSIRNGYKERVEAIEESLELGKNQLAEDLEAVENDEYGDGEIAEDLREQMEEMEQSREYIRELGEAAAQAHAALGILSAAAANDEISAELFGPYFDIDENDEYGSGYSARRALERALYGEEM